MRFTRYASLCLISSFAIGLPRTAIAAGPETPTMDQVQKDYDAKKYQDVIKEVGLVLPLATDPSKGYDKSALLALRGESQLQLKQFAPASESYAAAAKETKDPATVDLYRATAYLIKRSPSGTYTPKQPSTRPSAAAAPAGAAAAKPEPINIIEMKNRRDAMLALFNDESKAVGSKVESLKNQTTLSPNLMEAIKQVGDLRGLEMAATGADQASSQMLSGVGDHVNQLVSGAIKQMSDTVDKLNAKANETTPIPMVMGDGNTYTVNQRKGLISSERNQLNQVANTAKNVAATCDDLSKAMGAQQASTFANTKQQAEALAKKADDLAKQSFDVDQTQVPKNQVPNSRGVGIIPGTGTGTPTPKPPPKTPPK